MAITKRDREKVDRGVSIVAEPCAIFSRYPSLWEFLTATEFEDGSSRQQPTMTVFVEHRMLKACINDRAEGMVAFVTGLSLSSILEATEEGLKEDTLDWRRAQGGSKKR